MRILYSSNELHDEIKKVLASPEPGDRRVVLVAFVGGQAEAFLPDPEGLEIVCWLQPGATDALTLGRLERRGAKLFKSEHLHMKVYWSSSKGCVICSANASGNALGGGDQKEAGVWLPPESVNIEQLWSYADPKPIKSGDLKRFAIKSEKPQSFYANGSHKKAPNFLEWFLELPGRRDWKLGWWEETGEVARSAKEQARKSYGVKEPEDFVSVKRDQARQGDWFLSFSIPDGRDAYWLYVDFVIAVSRSDKAAYDKDYPFQAVQVNSARHYPRPPFKMDRAFKRAFMGAIKRYGAEKIADLASLVPPMELLNFIAENMRAAAKRK
jgi:hypothetical protein